MVRKSFGNRSGSVESLMRTVATILDKHCVIAGGALRDMYFGKVAKDIDVWCLDGWSSKNVYDRLVKQCPQLFQGHTVETFERLYEGMQVESVHKVTLKCGLVVDIIDSGYGSEDGFDVASEFDLNINQFWLKNRTIRSCNPDPADIDSLTVHGKRINNDRDLERVLKFMNKFPEFNWIAYEIRQDKQYNRRLGKERVRKMMEKNAEMFRQNPQVMRNPFEAGRIIQDDLIAPRPADVVAAGEVHREWF